MTDDDPDDGSAQWMARHRRPPPPEDQAGIARQIAALEAELAEGRARMAALDVERVELIRQMPRGGPFVCVCGVEGDPFDPEYERIHREHVMLAGLDALVK